jgi:hypothetical protein
MKKAVKINNSEEKLKKLIERKIADKSRKKEEKQKGKDDKTKEGNETAQEIINETLDSKLDSFVIRKVDIEAPVLKKGAELERQMEQAPSSNIKEEKVNIAYNAPEYSSRSYKSSAGIRDEDLAVDLKKNLVFGKEKLGARTVAPISADNWGGRSEASNRGVQTKDYVREVDRAESGHKLPFERDSKYKRRV